VLLFLAHRRHVTENIWAYRFEPDTPLTWLPGQFIRVELPHKNPDASGTKRFFTISSTPEEKYLQITTRLTNSPFKKAMDSLSIGSSVQLIDRPAGDFIWKDSPRPHVFVARGIGITPFYAIIKSRIQKNLPIPVHLLYSSYDPSTSAFVDELRSWQIARPEFSLHLTQAPIDAPSVAALVTDLRAHMIYISGPDPLFALFAPPFNLPSGQLKTDYFPGYSALDY
jgi:ferredoxin-NADP reductase